MPTISSNTLFHFTKPESLLGILQYDFYPKFCLERYQIDRRISPIEIGIPMVSFCDIPLSLVYNHMANYGNYGIGMSKEWAEKNRLNPVLYLREGSETTKTLFMALNSIVKYTINISNAGVEIEYPTECIDLLRKLFTFTKPFDGPNKDGGITKFYDEREWRYVPSPSSYNGSQIVLLKDDLKEPLLSEENEKLKNAKLHFQPNDINYIIIKEESERLDLINKIGCIKEKYDDNTRRVLLSKIISAEQISQDF